MVTDDANNQKLNEEEHQRLFSSSDYEKCVNPCRLLNAIDRWIIQSGQIFPFEGARRTLGPATAIIATIFLIFEFYGSSTFVPDVSRWGSVYLTLFASQTWITPESAIGTAAGMSVSLILLFSRSGAQLDKEGAGNCYFKMAFGTSYHQFAWSGRSRHCQFGCHWLDLKNYLPSPNAARVVRHSNCLDYVVR